MSLHYLVKYWTHSPDQSFIVSPKKWIALKTVSCCVLWKLDLHTSDVTGTVNTPSLLCYWSIASSTMLCWHWPTVSTNHWCAVWLPLQHIPAHFVSSQDSHSKPFLISKKTNITVWEFVQMRCSKECSRWLIAEKKWLRYRPYSSYILQVRWKNLQPSGVKYSKDSMYKNIKTTHFWQSYSIKRINFWTTVYMDGMGILT